MRDWGEAARYQVITPGERRLMTQLALQLGLPRDEARYLVITPSSACRGTRRGYTY